MGPQPIRPNPAIGSREEDIAGGYAAAPIHRQVAERRQDVCCVIRQRFHGSDGIRDEQAPLYPAIVGGVVVIGLGLGRPDVDCHHVAVGEQVCGVVEVVLFYRAIVAVAGVAVAVTVVDDFRLRDGSDCITEINQQGQPQLLSCRGPGRWRLRVAVLRGSEFGEPLSALQIAPTPCNFHTLIPTREAGCCLLAHCLGIDSQVRFEAQRRRIAPANGNADANELLPVGGQLRVLVASGLLVEDDRVSIQGFEHSVEFVALPPEHNLCPVRLRERHLLCEGRARRGDSAEKQQAGKSDQSGDRRFHSDPLWLLGNGYFITSNFSQVRAWRKLQERSN